MKPPGNTSPSTGAAGPQEVGSELGPLLDKLPASDYATAREVLEELLRGGPATIEKLVTLVGEEFGDPRGVKPKYAVHGLAHHASRPGADAQRGMVAETFAKLLDSDHSDDLKAFLCRQLQLCGRPQEVPALVQLLEDDRLCEPVTQAMTAIGGPQAAEGLRLALERAAGKRRVTILNALGGFGDPLAARETRKDVAAGDQDQRAVAWYALGSMGDVAATDALLKAATGKASYERTQGTDACLRLARALAKKGKISEAEKICRQLMSMREGPEDVHDRCAALECLATVLGAKAVDDVLVALDSKERRLRHPVARNAVDLARAIQKSSPRAAEKLLRKVLEATIEEAVLIDARVLLKSGR